MIGHTVLLGLCKLCQDGRMKDTKHIFCEVFGSTPNMRCSTFCQKNVICMTVEAKYFLTSINTQPCAVGRKRTPNMHRRLSLALLPRLKD